MLLRSLRLTAFRQFAELAIELRPGITLITGANGAGKSTLLEGIVWALFGAGAARRTEASLRSAEAGAVDTAAVLELDHEGTRCRVARVLRAGFAASDVEASPYLPPVTRDAFMRACFTGRRELQQLAQLGPAERLAALARLTGAAQQASADDGGAQQPTGAVAAAVRTLEEELADATRRMETLGSAPDLLTQYGAELDRARAELQDAEAQAQRVHDDWAQKRQDVQTRLDAHRRRGDELKQQIERLGAAGATGTCPTCEQPLGSGIERMVGRLDDEYYITTQDVKWLTQRRAQLERRPPDVLEADTRRDRLRSLVADRTERVARCEQAVQELWSVAQEQRRTMERLDTLRVAAPPSLIDADRDAVAACAGEYVARVTDWHYSGLALTSDGRVYGERGNATAPIVSGADEDLFALALRLAAARIAAERTKQRGVLLLDEPFGSLDAQRCAALIELLRDVDPYCQQVLITTHDESLAVHADHCITVDNGAVTSALPLSRTTPT
jgi:DNA repair exonuclease SbcCD ATPase subunit